MDDVVLHTVKEGPENAKGDLVLVLPSFFRPLSFLDILVVCFIKETMSEGTFSIPDRTEWRSVEMKRVEKEALAANSESG